MSGKNGMTYDYEAVDALATQLYKNVIVKVVNQHVKMYQLSA